MAIIEYDMRDGITERERTKSLRDSVQRAFDEISQEDHNAKTKYYTQAEVDENFIPKDKVWKTLWEGSASSGTITVPGTEDYNFFILTFNNQGTVIPAFKWENNIRGLGGYAQASQHHTKAFTATFDEDVWTITAQTYANHKFSGDHTAATNMTLTSVIGVL